ncbi:CLUMA_CG007022, isoform A [Clunio marinus]|uniref:CLUMA_CG007022, isoform A n=1 Tax=Clunio marinus TaxID=568069 RepID=A0A1J1I3P8_9DIPT|nr:CLUMA_CG007022, isoform A [Clunio marinus]
MDFALVAHVTKPFEREKDKTQSQIHFHSLLMSQKLCKLPLKPELFTLNLEYKKEGIDKRPSP